MTFSRRFLIVLPVLALPLLAGQVSGIKNFDKVDDHVYRGGQPTPEGIKYLAGLGVKVVIDLREPGSRSVKEEKDAIAAGMKYVNVPMTGLTPPSDDEITRILALLESADSGPVFVHCMRGADRTGAVIAAYHIDHDKWENTKALQDAMAHHMSFFQFPRQGFIKSFKAHTVEASVQPADGAALSPAVPAAGAVKN